MDAPPLICRVCGYELTALGYCFTCERRFERLYHEAKGHYDIPLSVPVGDAQRAHATMAIVRALRTYCRCEGTGHVIGWQDEEMLRLDQCPQCGGDGEDTEVVRYTDGSLSREVETRTCEKCKGGK